MAEILGRLDRRAVHHLHAARDDAGGNDLGHAIARGLVRGESDEQRLGGVGPAQDAHRDLGDHPQQSLRAGQHPEKVVALGIEVLAAEPDHLAVHQHDLEAEQVVGGKAVLETVHATRVLGHVAADGAGDLARGIGRVIEALVGHRVGNGEVGDAGLGDDATVGVIDLEDAVELGEPEDDAVCERQRPARERGPGAPRHHLHPLGVAQGEDARDLIGGLGQDHRERHLAVGGQPVAFVRAQRVLIGNHALAGNDGPEGLDDSRPLGDDRPVGLGHAHGWSRGRIATLAEGWPATAALASPRRRSGGNWLAAADAGVGGAC